MAQQASPTAQSNTFEERVITEQPDREEDGTNVDIFIGNYSNREKDPPAPKIND